MMRFPFLLMVLISTSLLMAPALAATLRRALEDSEECPANQQFLPDVQFGCPASCDQPIPLCKAAIGPGCGCRKGTVIAGSSRPRTPKRCINPKKCRKIAPTCPDGAKPLKGSFCGLGGKSCPKGYSCNTDPLDRFAVCCPDPYVPPPPPTCFVTGCNGEVCTDNPDIATICVVPSCEVLCLVNFGTCTSSSDQCGWDTSAVEKDYQLCLARCSGDY